MTRRLFVLLFIVGGLIGAAIAPAATAPTRNDALPLHGGSSGPRVAAVQWLVSGHRPNVFTKVKPTLKVYTKGIYGSRTKAAVQAYKYRIGFPAKGQCPSTRAVSTVTNTAGKRFFDILLGHKQRPICWVALAQQRIKIVVPGASKMALAIKSLEVAQLGVHEVPSNSNRGPCISYTCRLGTLGYFGPYQGSTGAYGLAWCASFQQWAFGARGPGYFANRSALVSYIEHWAQQRGYLNAKAKVGSLVAFLDDGGHMGYVTKVLASGYVTIEGNASNSVKQVYHPWNDRLRVFINLPGVA